LIYTVQNGDTPMRITHKITGDPRRVAELVRANAHKPAVNVGGHTLTFRELHVGEKLTVPPNWHSRANGLGDCSPNYRVRPNAQISNEDYLNQGDSEPVRTASGPSHKPCCARCGETGGSCGGSTGGSTVKHPCSTHKAPQSIPGSTSFPVGFGQGKIRKIRTLRRGVGQGPITTQVPAVAVVSSWGLPLAIGALSAAAGFGLAYLIAKD
jgi:hypothetical protein